jgi:FkbM family methyltransferase
MQQGSSNTFRTPSATERLAASVRGWLPSGMRDRLRSVYNALLSRTAGDFVCTLPGGEQIRVLPEHRQITWNPEEYAAFRAAVHSGDIAMDIGANLGAYALLFGKWVGPTGRVFAFEPAPVPFAGLTAHVALNDLSGHVCVRQEAVTSQEGVFDFIADGIDGENRLTTDHAGRAVVRVAATSLDAFCASERVTPTFIKIDAEGAELDVLRGARRTIKAAGSRLALFVEMHPHLWAGFNVSRADLEAEIAHQGLRIERIDGDPDIWGIEGVCLRLRPCAS